MKPVVIIRQCPVDSFSYFQWFLLGLYLLEEKGVIKLKIRTAFIDKVALFWCNNKYMAGGLRRLAAKFIKVPRYNLVGEIIDENGKKKSFAIDSKDSPFVFTVSDLTNCDAYFKLQCPAHIGPEGFEIATGVYIPWQDVNFFNNKDDYSWCARRVDEKIFDLSFKIHPAMVGPRRLGWTCKKSVLVKNYNNYITSYEPSVRKKMTAYFGSAGFPTPSHPKNVYDLDWESDLISFLGTKHSHPNEKREKAVQLMKSLNDENYDGRLIRERDGRENTSLVVPLNDFCDYLAKYEYNLNISGFRLSIPNRFIESFMAGTAIVTDKLSVKWYLPFDEEVVESVRMGYEKDSDVDWEKWRNDIINLPKVESADVKKRFKQKWSPEVFAKYVIDTTIKS